MINKKEFVIFGLLFLFLIPLISATTTLGTYKLNECVELRQTCASCSYVNFTRVSYPNSAIALVNVQASQSGSLFTYQFCNTNLSGVYIVDGIGDVDGTDTVFVYDFEVTPTGTANDKIFYGVLVFFMCMVAFILIYLGAKEPWKYFYNLIGGMLLALSGIFLWLIVLAGIDEPLLRMGVSWILIGVGAFFIFKETSKLTKLTSEEEEEDEWDT